jgi:hypothetical protein
MDQYKLFYVVASPEHVSEQEAEINTWLQENSGKIKIISREIGASRGYLWIVFTYQNWED